MKYKIPETLLFLISFVIISIGGYQCATRVISQPDILLPVDKGPNSSLPPGSSGNSHLYDEEYLKDIGYKDDKDNRNSRLPSEPEDSCRRRQYNDLADEHGAIAGFKFDKSSVRDYHLGQSQNFGVKCPRLFLDMTKSSPRTYKGILTIVAEINGRIQGYQFSSGEGSDNRYNRWDGSSYWRGDNNGRVSKNFHAIFESSKQAIILKLEDIRIRDIKDGEQGYFGAGEIYYKMFRIWTGDKSDVCYSKGAYVSQAHTPPARRGSRCWLLGTGPFSCRPKGVLHPRAKVTAIDITANSYKCYNRLGRFFGLNIEKAFNSEVRYLY